MSAVATGTKLNLLMCITPRHFSGAERVLVNLASGLQERGHQVLVLTKPQERLVEELGHRSVPVRAVRIGGKLNRAAPYRITQAAQEIEADVIYTVLSSASLWGGYAGRLAGLPVVSNVHALNSRVWYGQATRVIACSWGVQHHLVEHGVPESKIEVIYNGVDPARLQGLRPGPEVRRDLGVAQDAPVICAVAHLHKKKGHRYLLEAVSHLVRRHQGLQLLCVGRDSGQQAVLQRQAVALGIADRARFLGFRPDVLSVVNASDIVVLPSVAKEGLGMALTEAAFLGKPTVGTDIPGVREALVGGETGYLVPPADADALVQRLDELLSDADLRKSMGQAGREWAPRTFSLQRQLELTEAAFARAMTLHTKRLGDR